MAEPEAAVAMMLVAVEQPVPPASVQLVQVKIAAAALNDTMMWLFEDVSSLADKKAAATAEGGE
jgi:hypothetical protein